MVATKLEGRVRNRKGVNPYKRWHVLSDLVQKHDWRIGAELGVFRGQNLTYLLEHNIKLNMIGVDVWEPQPDKEGAAPGGRSYESHDLEGYYYTLNKLVNTQYSDRCTLIRRTTTEASSIFPDGHFDFVFIDADHTLEGVVEDIKNWAPKVNKEGWILGHDFQHKFPGVRRAVREIFPNYQLFADSVWGLPIKNSVYM